MRGMGWFVRAAVAGLAVDASCGEIANRQLTLTYGTTGTQNVNDSVSNWRNVAPCGN